MGSLKNEVISKMALSACLLALVAGCGQKEEPTPILKPKPPTKPPGQAEAALVPGAPPPAPDAVAPAPQAAAAPGAPTSVNDPAMGDPLIYFRRATDGTVRDDLQALNAAVYVYCQRAGRIEDFGKPPLPTLKGKTLSVLVETGFLKGLPTPPAGKKYVLDQKTMEVSLK